MEELKTGDVVVLKSGGSRMTIEDIQEYNDRNIATCSWFSNGEYKSQNIYLEALKLYVEEPLF